MAISSDPITFRAERDLGDVLNTTFHFLRQNVAPLGKAIIYVVSPVWLFVALINAWLQVHLLGSGFMTDPNAVLRMDWTGLLLAYGGIVVFGLLSYVMNALVVFGFITRYRDGGPGSVSVADVWTFTKRHFGRFLGITLLLGLLYVLAAVLLIIPCLGWIGFVWGVVYFGVVFSLVFPMLAEEPVGLFESLSRSRYLAKQHWWLTAGVLVVSWITAYILGFLFNVPVLIITFVVGFSSTSVTTPAWVDFVLVVFTLLSSFSSMFVASIPMTATAFQYYNLVERKERVGLMERVEKMGGTAGPGVETG